MSNVTKCWIELRRLKQHSSGTWTCHYVIFEFGPHAWRCQKGCANGTFQSSEAAVVAALSQAKRVIDSLQATSSYV